MPERPNKGQIGSSSTGDDLDAALSSLAFDHAEHSLLATVNTSTRSFGIRAADSEGRRATASMLVRKMYAWRGYQSGFTVGEGVDQITLVAADYHQGPPIGTLTIGLDRGKGLLADGLYHEEARRLRDEGCQLCEMIKFAVEHDVKSKYLLGSLFHVAFIYAFHIHKCSDLLIEVTPQHARFYRHFLGFVAFGPEKLNPRVNTLGVLMRLSLEYTAEQIRRFGGQGAAAAERSLYPYGFSEREEKGIIERLRRLEFAQVETPTKEG